MYIISPRNVCGNMLYINKEIDIEQLNKEKYQSCTKYDFYRFTKELRIPGVVEFKNVFVSFKQKFYCKKGVVNG